MSIFTILQFCVNYLLTKIINVLIPILIQIKNVFRITEISTFICLVKGFKCSLEDEELVAGMVPNGKLKLHT